MMDQAQEGLTNDIMDLINNSDVLGGVHVNSEEGGQGGPASLIIILPLEVRLWILKGSRLQASMMENLKNISVSFDKISILSVVNLTA
jgi:hypothetical protein